MTDYPNLITCRIHFGDQESTLSGALFGGTQPRIVRINEYRLEAKPEGVILLLRNEDVPGVVGQIGTLLAAYNVNIGEWRMGREEPGKPALSVINLDSEPPAALLDALEQIPALKQVKIITL